MTYIVLDNQKGLKNTFQQLHLTLKKIPALFKELHRNLRTFQGKMEFKDFSRTSPKIQGLLKTVQTLSALLPSRENFLGILFLQIEAF